MKFSSTRTLPLLLVSAALAMATMTPVSAQTSAAAQTGTPAAASNAKPTKAELKAQRKAARKQAHAEHGVELKKLEATGYQSGKADPNYPQSMQTEEKKAGIAQGASQ